jgi:EAL domain-containing protein (putative c-di-GMP-specific phosphodiesterase class I)
MRVEAQLLHAVDRGELVVHFQPIIDVRSNALYGAEALVRWNNLDLGYLEPDDFVPLAEDTGLIVGIGRAVLDAACREAARWHRQGFPHLSIAVNIASRQLRGRALVDTVAETLAAHRLRADRLELEITESSLMHDAAETMETLRVLSAMGVRLALDDFGTGFSCLSHLKDMPVDTVKIDKSFVRNVVTDPGNATVVEAVLAMARRLGIRVIAEGVETRDQLAFLAERGCELAQGFYFGEAIPGERFLDGGIREAPAPRQAVG